MKKLISIAIASMTATLLADTITWTGGAGTADWATAGNWDLNREPLETDDVVIDGAAVTANGSHRIPLSLTLLSGASYSIEAKSSSATLASRIQSSTEAL